MGFVFGGPSALGFAFDGVEGSDSFGSSSSSDHGVLFFGTVFLDTTGALGDDCASGGDNALGAEVAFGNEAFFCTAGLGEPAFDVAAFGDVAFGDATLAMPQSEALFGSVAFGDIDLGECTDLGTDLAFGEDGGPLMQAWVPVVSSGSGQVLDFQQMRQKYHEVKSVIDPCSAIAGEPFLTTRFLTTEDS